MNTQHDATSFVLRARVRWWTWLTLGLMGLAVVGLAAVAVVNGSWGAAVVAAGLAVVVVSVLAVASAARRRHALVAATSATGIELRTPALVRFLRWDDVTRVREDGQAIVFELAESVDAESLAVVNPGAGPWTELKREVARRLDAAIASPRTCTASTTGCGSQLGCAGSSSCRGSDINT